MYDNRIIICRKAIMTTHSHTDVTCFNDRGPVDPWEGRLSHMGAGPTQCFKEINTCFQWALHAYCLGGTTNIIL